ncbi:serine hydrolase [Paenibacillus filicis]|uniref:Serine hydrolase n=2 Tax=Paenibacillus gyeongsangnamensis TaxID=3388067 RepID=A0ABT4QL77_9BACL|nr:serine hydrolase [Paenibacillus filicis]
MDYTSPEKQGMNSSKLLNAFRLLDRETERGEIPGGVAIVGRHGRIVGTYKAGLSIATDFAKYAVREDTIYDCASLTKVVVTLPLILLLLDNGEVRLNDPVCRYIPDFAAKGKSQVTLKHLLTHTSGLPAFTDMYSQGWSPEEIKKLVWNQELTYETGKGYVYSDLGYIALGEIVSKLLGQSIDSAARDYIFEPLGMADTGYRPHESLKPRIAATEFIFGSYRWGEVHDKNTWAMGGVSGHAGMFSTAADLAKYAMMWLNLGRYPGGRLLSASAVTTSTRNFTSHLNANRGLGWVLKGDKWDASGDWSSPASYGHTGFTGTSLWMDPEKDVFAVLLTNRVHFGRDKSVAWLRDSFHNAVSAAVED